MSLEIVDVPAGTRGVDRQQRHAGPLPYTLGCLADGGPQLAPPRSRNLDARQGDWTLPERDPDRDGVGRSQIETAHRCGGHPETLRPQAVGARRPGYEEPERSVRVHHESLKVAAVVVDQRDERPGDRNSRRRVDDDTVDDLRTALLDEEGARGNQDQCRCPYPNHGGQAWCYPHYLVSIRNRRVLYGGLASDGDLLNSAGEEIGQRERIFECAAVELLAAIQHHHLQRNIHRQPTYSIESRSAGFSPDPDMVFLEVLRPESGCHCQNGRLRDGVSLRIGHGYRQDALVRGKPASREQGHGLPDTAADVVEHLIERRRLEVYSDWIRQSRPPFRPRPVRAGTTVAPGTDA